MLTTHNRQFILLATFIAVLIPLNKCFELPFLQSCTYEDEKCHIEQVNKFFEMYGNGIEELDIPTLSPMHLGDITIKGNNNDNFNLQLFMENVDLYKFPVVKCQSIKGFSKEGKAMRVVLKMFSPQLIIKAHCRVKGKLLLFNVAGDTDLNIDIKNVTTTMKARCSPFVKDGVTYYKAEELKPKLDIGSLSTSFKNSTLFNGEEIFMETFADTINENWEVLRDEIEPHLNDAVARVSIGTLNKILATMPFDKYFKKSE
ncbi:circadian clock-controlled protein daywake-like [Lucilia cuprina]|uniref:circadian clock-controlled protein daywake-like n=1 Tax=Lucilia cuprina TaxID=7375 RepID=UPI001F053D3F|nr:circadian clock-controlled protein daywake-like [Lucilia cuprina]